MTPCTFGVELRHGQDDGLTPARCESPASWVVTASTCAVDCGAEVSHPACEEHAEVMRDRLATFGIKTLLRPMRPDPPASGEVPAVVPPVEPWWRAVMDRFTRRARRDPEEAA